MIKLSPIIFVGVLAIAGCTREPAENRAKPVEASATASVSTDGRVVTRKATSSELEALEQRRALYEAVDAKYPKPSRPANAQRLKAKQVLSNGHIQLQDGRTIVMDGIGCSVEGTEYLGRWLTGPSDYLVVVPTGAATDGVTPANVWVVDDMAGGGVGESFPADGAVTSGWCSSVKTRTSTLTDRFEALQALFADERRRHAP